MEFTPKLYEKFKCIADRCRHSCCIGWEIDIDEITLSYYNSLDTQMGKRIRQNIEGDVPHFVLTEGERCPFLNKNGLCDIITECGEDALCDICRLHPRFSNFFDSFTETGLGLCCEEAVRIVLGEQEKFTLNMPDKESITDEEKEFLSQRSEVFAILQDRDKSIGVRFDTLAKRYGFEFDFSLSELCRIYLSLERLDENWTGVLESTACYEFDKAIFEEHDFELIFEQLSCYFIFRHLADAMWYGDYCGRIRFTLMSCYLIGALISNHKNENNTITHEEIYEIVRMYSSEIEYSEENLEKLLSL